RRPRFPAGGGGYAPGGYSRRSGDRGAPPVRAAGARHCAPARGCWVAMDVLWRLAACPPEEAPEEARRGLFLASGDVLGGRGGPEASGAISGPGEAKGTQTSLLQRSSRIA